MPPQKRVVILTETVGWHCHQLQTAFATYNIDTVPISLRECSFNTTSRYGIILPVFGRSLPDGMFVRGIPYGTFPQVSLRLGLLHALQQVGVPVYNEARAIERTLDKSMTSFLLKQADIPTPSTWVCESRKQARRVMREAFARGEEVVIKPLLGSQGSRLVRLRQGDELPKPFLYEGVYYLQTFVAKPAKDFYDWRVFVIGGRAVAAMLRRHDHWITNHAQGASCQAVALEETLTHLAEAAVQALQIDYAGVDIIDNGAGKYYVLEVNGLPAWHGLQQVCSNNLAQCLVEDFVKRHYEGNG
jgi:tetrahydromethanopterin:alpha-L-glutamate ligase